MIRHKDHLMPNVSLTKQMQEYAEAQVASGAYANVSEVVREGMRRLMERERAEFEALRSELQQSLAEPAREIDLRAFFYGDKA
ncbi:MAG: type II toxin-antitoxin system ParD family antitoxin [Pseudomonadota bacterium]